MSLLKDQTWVVDGRCRLTDADAPLIAFVLARLGGVHQVLEVEGFGVVESSELGQSFRNGSVLET